MRRARVFLLVAGLVLLTLSICDLGWYLLNRASFAFCSIAEGPFDVGPLPPVMGLRGLLAGGLCFLIRLFLPRKL